MAEMSVHEFSSGIIKSISRVRRNLGEVAPCSYLYPTKRAGVGYMARLTISKSSQTTC